MTILLYQTDSYLGLFDASVTAVDEENRAITLDQTAFYPGGGGQPFDSGTLSVENIIYPIKRAKKCLKTSFILLPVKTIYRPLVLPHMDRLIGSIVTN